MCKIVYQNVNPETKKDFRKVIQDDVKVRRGIQKILKLESHHTDDIISHLWSNIDPFANKGKIMEIFSKEKHNFYFVFTFVSHIGMML